MSKDFQSIILKAIMNRYEGLVPLIESLKEDPDTVYLNIADDIGDILSIEEIETIIYNLIK